MNKIRTILELVGFMVTLAVIFIIKITATEQIEKTCKVIIDEVYKKSIERYRK